MCLYFNDCAADSECMSTEDPLLNSTVPSTQANALDLSSTGVFPNTCSISMYVLMGQKRKIFL